MLPASEAMYPQFASTGELGQALDANRTMAYVNEEDVGQYAAAALLDPSKFHKQEIELRNENITTEGVSGREVKARRRTAGEVEQATTGSETLPLSLSFELRVNQVKFRTDRAPTAEKFRIPFTSVKHTFARTGICLSCLSLQNGYLLRWRNHLDALGCC
jgi:hypothetical protein